MGKDSIEFIKKCVPFAGNYAISSDECIFVDDNLLELCKISEFTKYHKDNYRDLLQNTIEGINRGEDFEIMQTRSNIIVTTPGRMNDAIYFKLVHGKENEAKIEALEKVFELMVVNNG